MFLELATDIATHVNLNGEYAVEFATDGVFLFIFIRFWTSDELSKVFLKRTSCLQGQTSAEMCLISYLNGVLSTTPNLICSTGCSVRSIQLIDQSPYSKFSVQSPPRLEEFNLPQLMHKRCSSFFARLTSSQS